MSQPASETRDPWDRFGWVMGVVWLVFLLFPLIEAVTADLHVGWRALAVTLILLFAAIYIHGLVRLGGPEPWERGVRWGPGYVGALAALMVAVTVLLGFEAFGMMPYVVALAMFVLPRPAAIAVFVAAIVVTAVAAATIAAPWSGTDEAGVWFLVLIVVLVGIATGAVRVLDQLGVRHLNVQADLAMTAEHERVARDVHDVLGHSLTVVTVKAELAERLVDADPDRARAELGEIQSLSRQALAEIRATVGGLRAATLDEQIVAARVALEGAGIRADLPDDPSVVDPRHRIVLGWALREAVTNVVRHSAATTCRVDVGPSWLCVSDDGRGLRDNPEGNGLRGLRERVGAAGGAVELAGATDDAGTGTTLKVRL